MVLTAALLIYGVYYRWVDVPQKWLLTREALVALIVVAGLCDVWLGVRAYLSHTEKRTWQKTALPCAPAANASCCPRISNTANCSSQQAASSTAQTPLTGANPTALALHGLDAVRFLQPVGWLACWRPPCRWCLMRVELADNQRIGPVHRYDTATQTWVPNKVMPTLQCRRARSPCSRCRTSLRPASRSGQAAARWP